MEPIALGSILAQRAEVHVLPPKFRLVGEGG